jgi:hypothetical protein
VRQEQEAGHGNENGAHHHEASHLIMLPVDGADMERKRAKMTLIDQCFDQLKR